MAERHRERMGARLDSAENYRRVQIETSVFTIRWSKGAAENGRSDTDRHPVLPLLLSTP